MSTTEHAAYIRSTLSAFQLKSVEDKVSKKELIAYWIAAAAVAALLVYTFPLAPWH